MQNWTAFKGWVLFIFSTDSKSSGSYPKAFEQAISAFTSLGKHEPPYPKPASRNSGPIRLSIPMAEATTFTSAPEIFSHMLAMVLMKLIFVASMELLAYLISSAVERVVLIIVGILSP